VFNNIGEIVIKILLTIILSGLIGLERSTKHKGAGLRTHILVGVGSALIVLTSFFIFDIYKDITVIDPTRMVAGLITGIGFLCAGTIISTSGQISGLTTAAALWIVSCIGMAVGAGHYSAACIVAGISFLVLTLARSFEQSMGEKFKDLL
jgi:putative Mg2+ transporter-C (MgtC) family protein